MKARRTAAAALLAAALCLLAAGCGSGDDDRKIAAAREPDPPVGTPVLPDLMPRPQYNVLTKQVDGRWRINFTTVIVNVGKGDFILRAKRDVRGGWRAEQDIPYSEGGAERVPIRAPIVWGGDGHSHWHIVRVASVWLVPLDGEGEPVTREKQRIDGKIGFCFYDHTRELPRGREEPTYYARSCGEREDTVIGMGLSPGWNDTYLMKLPGQSIDVEGLPAGKYRLFTEIDDNRWFRERTRANNLTWIDLDIRMTKRGLAAPTIATGPVPS